MADVGSRHRSVFLKHIYAPLTKKVASALPGLHAVSGADITGSFAGKDKTTYWKAFNSAGEKVLHVLSLLGTPTHPTNEILEGS